MGQWSDAAILEIANMPEVTRTGLTPGAVFMVVDVGANDVALKKINKSELKYGLGVVEYTSAVAVSHTGDTLETTLATVTIPGGLLKANSVIEILSFWDLPAGIASKDARIYFGGEECLYFAENNARADITRNIYCNNSLVSQKSMPSNIYEAVSTGPMTVYSVDTTVAFDITFKGTLGNAADTIRLQGYRIKLNGV